MRSRPLSMRLSRLSTAVTPRASPPPTPSSGSRRRRGRRASRGTGRRPRPVRRIVRRTSGSKITIQVDSLRFLGPETALEEGRATISVGSAAEGRAHRGPHHASPPKESAARMCFAAIPAHHCSPLTASRNWEWLVGDMGQRKSGRGERFHCLHVGQGRQLPRSRFTMKMQGRPVLGDAADLGRDPLKRQFKTWIFDSEGGHGEGYFTHNGNQWVIKSRRCPPGRATRVGHAAL